MKQLKIIWELPLEDIPLEDIPLEDIPLEDILMAIVQEIGQIVLLVEEQANVNIAVARGVMNIPAMDAVEYVEEQADVQVVMAKEVPIINSCRKYYSYKKKNYQI